MKKMIERWLPGDHVTRKVFMDDGTWNKEGDQCLQKSPLHRGVVIARSATRDDEVYVRFNDGEERRYLDHGLDADTLHA